VESGFRRAVCVCVCVFDVFEFNLHVSFKHVLR
jgi:hypothetical protein